MERSARHRIGGHRHLVTALCPGPTDTVFFPKAGITGTCAFQGKPQCSSGGQEDAAEYSLNLHKGT